ncbi:MAG: helix-turn-helix domain-containing protein [Candidatus Marinarcus sp.]|uniref:helix-turn-helix domain-containing protein n=1 Tax=Candidatus Marinarcus sp. TaxID=3100987 RepID=UPI003B001EA4
MKNIEEFDIDELHKRIGDNVKRLREEKKLSQLELSHAIGHKSVSVISNGEIYHNKSRFNVEHLGKIAYVLDVNIEEFFK